MDSPDGGMVYFSKELLRKSKSLQALVARLDAIKGWSQQADGSEVFMAHTSPPHPLNLCRSSRRAASVPDGEEVYFVWVYPAQLDWPLVLAPGEEAVDSCDPDVSFFTVGGYMYIRMGMPRRRLDSSREQAWRSSRGSSSSSVAELHLISANAIVFDPSGPLKFSEPRKWEAAATQRLSRAKRFQSMTAQVWTAQGVRHIAWVQPNECMPLSGCGPRLGGFAFIFHEPEEPDTLGLDRYFELVAAPDFFEEALPSTSRSHSMWLPFNIAAAPAAHHERQRNKLFQLAGRGQWPLALHLLAEYPQYAKASDDHKETLMHYCARHRLQDKVILQALRARGAVYDAVNESGETAEDLGDRAFRSCAREAWGLAPDLFEDAAKWFDYYDTKHNGILEPLDLAEALCATYKVDEVGRRWVKSFANTHHRNGLTKAHFLGERGLLKDLQFGAEFSQLRQNQTPPLFRPRLSILGDEDCAKLALLEETLSQLRAQHGWRPGAPAPQSAQRLQMPTPFPGGGLDVGARMRNARQMLSFSVAQTNHLPGKVWQKGFRIIFSGQEGVDDGGLTKAWAQELAFALWGHDDYFEPRSKEWRCFKPDSTATVELDGQMVRTLDLYRWTGRFVAYLLYMHVLVDCILCPWVFIVLHRFVACCHYFGQSATSEWPETPEGEDHMLEDLASLDPAFASSLWRVRHEMNNDELQWLDFTCCGSELLPNGAEIAVSTANKARYVRLCCVTQLKQQARQGLQAFAEGFLDVLPADRLTDMPEGGVQYLLLGEATLLDSELSELERLIVPAGLVPVKLQDHPRVREAAKWFFQAVRAGNGAFRSRLLEFWTGTSRVPLTGVQAIQPRPKLQLMVQPDGRGVKRISSWPRERLPEGHTCGHELWLPLQDSYEQTVERLRLAVENFEAGFALK
jgi:hypothetical protein